MKNFINGLIRFLSNLKKPSKASHKRRLRQRGEAIDDFIFREAIAGDIPALAALHVKTWNETYKIKLPPVYALREMQWREQFKLDDGSWFCFVIENRKGELVGFAKGNTYASSHLTTYSGELNKIYLLRDYQRLGLGRKLLGHVSRRFLSKGITTMVLFGIPQNPSCYFMKHSVVKNYSTKKVVLMAAMVGAI